MSRPCGMNIPAKIYSLTQILRHLKFSTCFYVIKEVSVCFYVLGFGETFC